jgi:branched-chain amino acid transport system permease protein
MDYIFFLATVICVWIILSVAANLVVGYTGLMSIGHAAYLAIGAYTAASLNIFLGVNFLIALPIAAVVTAVFAMLTVVPLLKLDTFYFALATMGLNVVVADTIHNAGPRVPGTEGLFGVTLPDLLASSEARMGLALVLAAGCVAAAQWIVTSPYGRSLRALRDREDALRSLGKNPRYFQISIWGVSGFLSGIAGAMYATTLFYIDPTVFALTVSFVLLVYIGVGGLASILGAILGPTLLIAFNEGLRFVGLPSDVAGQTQQFLYGLLLIGLMIFRRQGLVGTYDFKE